MEPISETAEKQSPIAHQIELVHKNLEELGITCGTLRDRLAYVLKASPPKPEKEKVTKAPFDSKMEEIIFEIRQHIGEASEFLHDLIDRLQV